jgi:large repetitive protein
MESNPRPTILRSLGQWLLPLLLVASGMTLGLAGTASAAAANGTGTMTTKTTSVAYGSTGHTITFTYSAATGGVSSGGVHLTVPSGWSAPSTTGTSAGYTTASTGTVSIDGQTIVVLNVTLAAGATLTINYGSKAAKGPGATATSGVGAATWTTMEKSTSGGTETNLAKSPVITVTETLATPAAPSVSLVSPSSIAVNFTPNPNAKSSTVTVRLAKDGSFVKAVEGDTTGSETITGLAPGDTYYVTITSVGNGTDYLTSAAGAHSGVITPGVLTVTARATNVTVGHPVNIVAVVTGLTAADHATVTKETFTYTGVAPTVYAASTIAPSAVGTYVVLPANATVVVSPSADQSVYATSYNYVAGSLVITAISKVPLRATNVVGGAWSGRTVTMTIIGSGFFGQPKIISSAGRGTTARVTHDTGKRLTLRVTVRPGSPNGIHVFRITLSSGKSVNVHYSQF